MNIDDRSTLRLDQSIRRAWAADSSVVLVGNTTDRVVATDGSPRALRFHLAALASDRGAACVLGLLGGCKQLPVPGAQELPLHLPDPDSRVDVMTQELLEEVCRSRTPVVVVFEYGDLVLPADRNGGSSMGDRTLELMAEFANSPDRGRDGHRLVVVAKAAAVDPRLSRLPGFVTVEVELPDLAERQALLDRALNPKSGPPLALADGLTAATFANLSGGLQLNDLTLARQESLQGHQIGRDWVQAQKVAALQRIAGDSLSVYPPGHGLDDVAGLPQLRRITAEALASGKPPRRLLLCGPPGVGKTLCVTSVADELGLPATALGTVRSMWLGESEQNMRRVINVVSALAPALLHIDEIDQAFGQRQTGQSADGGTSERLMADMLTFLGSNTGPRVTVVGTSNRPDLLDPAMFDRFTIVPVLHPTALEAAQILVIAARRERRLLDIDQAEQVVRAHGGLVTGRSLVDVLDRAITFADSENISNRVDRIHLEAAFNDLLMAVDQLEHERLALLAISLSTFRSYLPWEAARHQGLPVEIPAYVAPLLDSSGKLDEVRVRGRLRELSER